MPLTAAFRPLRPFVRTDLRFPSVSVTSFVPACLGRVEPCRKAAGRSVEGTEALEVRADRSFEGLAAADPEHADPEGDRRLGMMGRAGLVHHSRSLGACRHAMGAVETWMLRVELRNRVGP